MKLLILGRISIGYEEIKLIKEAKKIFDNVVYIPTPYVSIEVEEDQFHVKYKNVDLSNFECVLPRIPRSYRTFGFTILSLLKGKTYMPIEPMALFDCHNKFSTLLKLNEDLIPIPKTFLTIKRKTAEAILDKVDYPIVMKLLYGSLGKGVMFADSKNSAVSFMDTLEMFKEPIFIEEFVKNPGEDIRAYVIGEEVFASMKRKAKKDEMRSNIGVGGTGIKFELPDEYTNLALRSTRALKMEICGIDLIKGPKGPIVIEANVNAQFKELERITKKNVAKRIVEYVKEKVSYNF